MVVRPDLKPHDWPPTGGVVVVPQRHLALTLLSMAFLLIWTAVLSGVLISQTFKENVSAKQTLEVLAEDNRMARIVFAIGHEMVSTVDWLVSIGPKQRTSLSIDDAIGITWKMTDSVISDVRSELIGQPVDGLSKLLPLIESKLMTLRSNDVFVGQNPLKIMKFYDNLCEIIERRSYSLESLSNLPALGRHTPTTATTSYALFIKGMAKRFAQLSFGTVFVRSEISVNKSDYFYYHFISRELIDNAFQLNPRAQNRYLELQDNDRASDVLVSLMDGRLERGDNRLAALYLNSVKDEIAVLLRAKDFLNASIASHVSQVVTVSHKLLAFHAVIALIAMTAVLLSIALLCYAFRYTDCKRNSISEKIDSKTSLTVEPNDVVYSLEFDDKIKILGTNSYRRHVF